MTEEDHSLTMRVVLFSVNTNIMYTIISESQTGAYGLSMDFLLDSDGVMLAVDLRDYTGTIAPQFADVAVLLTYPDDLLWLLGGIEKPEYYSYVKTFKTYEDYCRYINQNTLS